MEFIIILVVMVGFMWLMTSQQRKMQKAQMTKREEALVVGKNVVTQSGFFGRIVDIDGEAVTLASPSGDETVWSRAAIAGERDIPFAMDAEANGEMADFNADLHTETTVSENGGMPATDGASHNNEKAVDSGTITSSNPFDEDEKYDGSAWK